MTISTEHLLLRPGCETDGPALYQNLWRHPEVFRYLFFKASPDEQAGIRRTAAYVQMHRQVPTEFFLVDAASGEPVGIAGVKELSPGQWTITDVAIGPAFQGKGYGKEAVRALVTLAFGKGASSVAYGCFAGNEASARLAKACGFSFVGAAPAELLKEGKPVVLHHYVVRNPRRTDGDAPDS